MKSIILGTRGSALALAQAEMAESALRAVFPDLNIKRRVIKTTGDRRTDIPLSEVARAADMDKGVFTKELEVSLQNGEIDIAVHSLKDMPSLLDEEFSIAAVLPRASRRDVLIGKESGGLKGLRHGAKVATSSVRRRRLLESMRPDLEIVDIRGNVPTRIHKLRESEELEGLLLAKAGLCRLDLLHDGVVDSGGKVLYVEELDETVFVPAAGQGAVGLEIRSGDMNALNACKEVNDGNTMRLVAAETRGDDRLRLRNLPLLHSTQFDYRSREQHFLRHPRLHITVPSALQDDSRTPRKSPVSQREQSGDSNQDRGYPLL